MCAIVDIKIETERLVLRNMRIDDVTQDYADWLNNPEVNKYISCSGKYQTIESCLAYVKSYDGRNDRALIGVFLKDNCLHIGNLTFSLIDWQNKTGTIGICIGRKEFMRKGYAKEALTAIVNYSFKQLNLYRLQAGININNMKSLNLFTKCGFKVKGLLRGSGVINGEFQDGYIVSIIGNTSCR